MEKLREYRVSVQTVLVDHYTISATSADMAHAAAVKLANDHLRDDGQMLEISSTVEGAIEESDHE